MVGLPELPASQPPGLGFSVSHQKVELEIDFRTRTLRGRTEITINPHYKELKTIRLNCRQCVLTRLNINGRGAVLKYQEPYSRFRIHSQAGVHQHHQLRQKLAPQLKEPPEEELLVHLPKAVRIEELNPFSFESIKVGGIARRDTGDAAVTPATPAAKGTEDLGSRFTPITMNIEFRIDKIVDPMDPSKKVVSFYCATPVAPQHVGFAVGAFEHVDLSVFRETDEDDKLGQNAVRIHGFCLPGRAEEVRNTCMPMAKAIDYFTLTYGSYPFTSCKLCFVDDLVTDVVETASLSICSNRLLFPEDIIEPLDSVTRQLVHSLASQWIGINIIPTEPTDIWVVVGIAYFITDMFMKKLCGNNEYRFRQKTQADRICDLDIARPSLHATGALLSLGPSELDFIALKAPVVLFILDRRLAKASGSSGLPRIISRIFLNAKVGELPNGSLTTAQFLRTCEKLGHTKLDTFFEQWVYGAGCPRFVVTQRFNKKKLVVEMLIKQTQGDMSATKNLETETFMRDVKEELRGVNVGEGPMTIRIHEADGTPYEHIVEIKDNNTKFEIPYNTKYKRLKRSRRQKERAAAAAGMDVSADTQDDVLLYCLGDVLQSEDEVLDWRLADWTKEDEEKMSQESYEWIRMDADFEWISKMSLGMPGYMYLSQLQQDRDSVAQYESIQYIAAQRETRLVSTILVRTLMDRRYFHGIRTAAALALARTAKDELDWVGLYHLERAFQEFFCFPDSPMTRANDFSDRTAYYIQCVIPRAMANVRDNHGRVPLRAKRFLFDKLKFNDNSSNEFSDSHYVATLMTAMSESLVSTNIQDGFIYSVGEDEEEHAKFRHMAIDEIERYRRMDEWISSYHNVYSVTALRCKQRLINAKVIQMNPTDFFHYTRNGTFDPLRLAAFDILVELGMMRNSAFLRYFFYVLHSDPSPYIRERMQRLLGKGMATFAIGERKAEVAAQADAGLTIEHDASANEARQADLRRTQTVPGALVALKSQVKEDATLQKSLWEAVTAPEIGLGEMRELLDLCSLLYEPKTSVVVKLNYPHYWQVKHLGHGKLKFTWAKKARTKKLVPIRLSVPPPPPTLKKEASSTHVGPTKVIFKKKPSVVPSATPPPLTPATSTAKPKLTIKLKLPGSGGASSP
ncbi:MAG: hypothetical protein M1832_006330 [Thelocarpon impressellum]|nr:MAG: hypothetical protein M1832_006330 [Thelocarpon impressellum]